MHLIKYKYKYDVVQFFKYKYKYEALKNIKYKYKYSLSNTDTKTNTTFFENFLSRINFV